MICSRGVFESLEVWCKKNMLLSFEGSVATHLLKCIVSFSSNGWFQTWKIRVEKWNFHL